MEEIFLAEEWSWKELGFENKNVRVHLFVVLKRQIKCQLYPHLQMEGPPQIRAPSKVLRLVYGRTTLDLAIFPSQAETMHQSQKVSSKVFCFDEYMKIKEDSFI